MFNPRTWNQTHMKKKYPRKVYTLFVTFGTAYLKGILSPWDRRMLRLTSLSHKYQCKTLLLNRQQPSVEWLSVRVLNISSSVISERVAILVMNVSHIQVGGHSPQSTGKKVAYQESFTFLRTSDFPWFHLATSNIWQVRSTTVTVLKLNGN